MLVAAAHFQLRDYNKAQRYLDSALDWGCSRRLIVQIIFAGLHTTLGRIAALREDQEKMRCHFTNSVENIVGDKETETAAFIRRVRELTKIGLLSEATSEIEEEIKKIVTGPEILAKFQA